MIFNFDEITALNGSNAKLAYLRDAVSYEPLLVEFFKLCFSYDKTWGISTASIKTVREKNLFRENTERIVYVDFLNLLQNSKRISLSQLTDISKRCTAEDFLFFSRILCKDLKCGVGIGLIKKIIPGLKEFLVQAANKDISVAQFGIQDYIAEPKLDGVRCIAILKEDTCTLFTRNGKKIENFKAVEKQLLEIFGTDSDLALDGELVCGKNEFSQLMTTLYSLKPIEEVINNTTYNIFDAMSLAEFESGKSLRPLKTRKEFLSKFYTSNKIVFVPHFKVSSLEETNMLFKDFVENGYEGLMLKDLNSFYPFKRTNDWLKIKPNDDYTLIITEVLEGTGKYTGCLGAVKGYYLEDETISVEVGSGFSDSERENLWKNKEELIGRKIDIVADSITHKKSFRFPIFKRFRDDL